MKWQVVLKMGVVNMLPQRLMPVLLLSACLGCIILPIPHYRHHLDEVNGVVLDSETKAPISGVDVVVSAGRYSCSTKTDMAGRFETKEEGGWHFIWWVATPSSGSLLPTHIDFSDGVFHDVTMSAYGYLSKTRPLYIDGPDGKLFTRPTCNSVIVDPDEISPSRSDEDRDEDRLVKKGGNEVYVLHLHKVDGSEAGKKD